MKIIKLGNDCYKNIRYYDKEEKKIESECYYNSKDERHRLDGPTVIWHHKNGGIISEYYYLNGNEYEKEEFNKLININRNLKLLNKK